jgi:hypothetical protein
LSSVSLRFISTTVEHVGLVDDELRDWHRIHAVADLPSQLWPSAPIYQSLAKHKKWAGPLPLGLNDHLLFAPQS